MHSKSLMNAREVNKQKGEQWVKVRDGGKIWSNRMENAWKKGDGERHGGKEWRKNIEDWDGGKR